MTPRCGRFALATALVTGVAGIAAAQTVAPRGWRVRVEQIGVSGPSIQGELIAVSPDTVWVLAGAQLVTFPVQSVRRVRVKRRPIGAKGIFRWGLVVGTVTGLGLTVACSSVEDTEGCPVLIPATLAYAALWSGLWAGVAGSEYENFSRYESELLKAYARFPQGLPPGLSPAALGVERGAVR